MILGCLAGGIMDIMNHPFFTSVNFDFINLRHQKIIPNFIPKQLNSWDQDADDDDEEEQNAEMEQEDDDDKEEAWSYVESTR